MYVIVDDASDESVEQIVLEFAQTNKVIFRRSETRLGIARAKNACIAVLQDCDHVFLFDDDAWPRTHNWAERWIAVSDHWEVGHDMYITPARFGLYYGVGPHELRDIFGEGELALNVWSEPLGAVLHFNRACLKALGGFETERAVSPYGYEHLQISTRAFLGGFTRGFRFLAPAIVEDIIFSIDRTQLLHYQSPPLPVVLPQYFQSTASNEDIQGIVFNAAMMENLTVHIPLVDPLPQ